MANKILNTTIMQKSNSGDRIIIYPKSSTKNIIDGSTTLDKTLETLKASDVSSKTTKFIQATTRENLVSGESLATSCGKIMKLIADLKSLAYSDKVGVSNLDTALTSAYNNRVTTDKVTTSTTITSSGYVADARTVNNLQNQINNLDSGCKSITEAYTNGDTDLQNQINELNKNITNNLLYKYMTFPDTIFDIAQRATKSERYFVVNSYFPSDLPEQAEFFIDVMVDQATARKNIIAWNYPSFRMYKRQMFNGKWLTDWQSNITNSDINVQKNTQKILLTTTKANVEISEPNNTYYIIRNDYCFVSLSAIRMSSIEGGNVFYNLPKPVGRVNFTLHLAGDTSKPIIWGRIDDTAIFFNNINSSLIGAHGWGSFCYPIAK